MWKNRRWFYCFIGVLLQLKLHNFKISETPSIFVNRKREESSANLRLILQSLFGLVKLYLIKLNSKN